MMKKKLGMSRPQLFNKPYKTMNVQLEKLLTIGGSALIGALVVNVTPPKVIDSYWTTDNFEKNFPIANSRCSGPFCIFQHFASRNLNGGNLKVDPGIS